MLYAEFAYTHVYYITPSSNASACPQNHCLPLSEFAADSTSYLGNQTNISLSFLPGNHSLDGELFLSQAAYFSVTKDIEGNGTVFIECGSQSGRFSISEMTFVVIKNLQFIGCSGNGVIQVEELVIEDTIFQGVEDRGTALTLNNITTARISSSLFHSNTHVKDNDNNITNIGSKFSGGALHIAFSNILIDNSTFTHNTAGRGGALFAHNCSLHIVGSIYSYNSANDGGVMATMESTVNITHSNFSNNVAVVDGGVILMYNDFFSISGTTYAKNGAGRAGGVLQIYESSFTITDVAFDNNAANLGGAISALNGHLTIYSNSFTNNRAAHGGGAIFKYNNYDDFTMTTFINIYNCTFINNGATFAGGIILCVGCSTHIANSTFDYNLGSLYVFNSNLTFSGYIVFETSTEPLNKTSTENPLPFQIQEGGAITSDQSTIIFAGESNLSNNQARQGGAIFASGSKVLMYGKTIIANNTATIISSGGGISLQQSTLEIQGKCIISNNHAMRGGGIHATSSTIVVNQPGTLHLINNRAKDGGGLYLEVNPKVNRIKPQRSHINDEHILVFRDNHANRGGAVYVADDTNSGACLSGSDCFIRTLILSTNNTLDTANILFSGNTASEQGANLFGGLLDRCIPSPELLAEVHLTQTIHYSGVSYLGNISNITGLDTISSLLVRVCFCKRKSEPDCSYQPPTISVKKGEAFTVSLVAVDQVNHSVDANIKSFLSSLDGGFNEGQQTRVKRKCSNVTFNMFSLKQ